MNLLTTRRSALRGLLQVGMGVAALPLIASRDAIGGGVVSQCPGADPNIGWVPDVMHPVAAGFQDLGISDGAPGRVRVWYPTADVGLVVRNAVPLNHCRARWPVVLFLHGQQPCPDPRVDPDYFKVWDTLPANLARSGYVVVVPSHSQDLFMSPGEALFVSSFVDWARSVWQHSALVDQRPSAVAVGGHSRGALLTATVARIRPDITAFFSLSGGWTENFDELVAIDKPMFFMWGKEGTGDNTFEDLEGNHVFKQLHMSRYGAAYSGEHFDYIEMLTGCDANVGECHGLTRLVSADLVALFLSRYLPVVGSATRIPVHLIPPDSQLTGPLQQFFANRRLNGLELIKSSRTCSIDMSVNVGLVPMNVHFGA
jgi:hypothetical protein